MSYTNYLVNQNNKLTLGRLALSLNISPTYISAEVKIVSFYRDQGHSLIGSCSSLNHVFSFSYDTEKPTTLCVMFSCLFVYSNTIRIKSPSSSHFSYFI